MGTDGPPKPPPPIELGSHNHTITYQKIAQPAIVAVTVPATTYTCCLIFQKRVRQSVQR